MFLIKMWMGVRMLWLYVCSIFANTAFLRRWITLPYVYFYIQHMQHYVTSRCTCHLTRVLYSHDVCQKHCCRTSVFDVDGLALLEQWLCCMWILWNWCIDSLALLHWWWPSGAETHLEVKPVKWIKVVSYVLSI